MPTAGPHLLSQGKQYCQLQAPKYPESGTISETYLNTSGGFFCLCVCSLNKCQINSFCLTKLLGKNLFMLRHENSKRLFKVCKVRLPVNSNSWYLKKKINIGGLVIVGNTAKDLGLKLSKKITTLKFGEYGWILYSAQCVRRSYFYSDILRAGSASRQQLLCWSWWRKQMWSLLSLIFQILLAKLFVCVQEITLKLDSQQFWKVFTMHNNKPWTSINHDGCYLLCQFCNGYSVFTFILFSSRRPIIFHKIIGDKMLLIISPSYLHF